MADIGPGVAVLISVALLAAGWFGYDLLCKALAGRELLLAAVVLGATTLAAWGTSELYSARAAWLQVGAMLGTAMAGNVFFVIIPAHWELIRAKQAGRDPDPAPGIKGKQRSVHNNYLTLPVLVTMLAGHSAFLYARSYAWVILVLLMLGGAATRLFFNLRHTGRTVWAIPAALLAATVVTAVVLHEDDGGAAGAAPVTFAQVAPVIAARCAPCHAVSPTQDGFDSPPAGVVLETPEAIAARSSTIATLVRSRVMPPGNLTGMTDEERDLVAGWVAAGAPTG